MKKLFILATAAVAFASCSDSDLVGNIASSQQTEQPQAVEFGTYMGDNTTRTVGGVTGEITTSVLQNAATNGFGVVAYMKGTNGAQDCYTTGVWNNSIPNFMWNQQVTYSIDHWTYTPVKFWPNDFATGNVDEEQGKGGEETAANGSVNSGKVSFFAYAPYVNFPPTTQNSLYNKNKVSQHATAHDEGIVAMTANDYESEPEVYYIMKEADADNAVDLLWALRGNSSGYDLADGNKDIDPATDVVPNYNTDLTKQSASEKVNFLFKHALSKIGGHSKAGTPAGSRKQTGLQVVLDIDNGSGDGISNPSTPDITGGTKQAQTLVTVESIKIKDLSTAKTDGLITDGTTDLVSQGWFNIATGGWTLGGTPVTGSTYSSEIDNLDSDDEGEEGYELNAQIKEDAAGLAYDASIWKTSANATGISGVTTSPQDVYTDDSDVPALLLIPSTTAQTLVVQIKYIVRTYDANLVDAASGGEGKWTKVEQTITNRVTIPANALKANTYYKLLIHLGLTSVKFTATACDWEGAANGGDASNPNNNNNNDKDIYLPSNTVDDASAAIEVVNTAPVTAGSSKTYSVPADNGSDGDVTFTISLSGISTSASALTAVATGATTTAPTVTSYSPGGETATITVTLPKNTSTAETQTTTVTVTATGVDQSTAITLVQEPKVATP